LKRSLLLLVVAVTGLAQTESQIQSESVRRTGVHIACQCGACQENVDCNMSSGQCHFCKPARTKIFQMQQQGKSDAEIIASFVQEYGQKIFRADPNSFFWLVPYLALGLGGVGVWMIVRRLRGTKNLTTSPAGHLVEDDPIYARYRDQIEKDTEKLN